MTNLHQSVLTVNVIQIDVLSKFVREAHRFGLIAFQDARCTVCGAACNAIPELDGPDSPALSLRRATPAWTEPYTPQNTVAVRCSYKASGSLTRNPCTKWHSTIECAVD